MTTGETGHERPGINQAIEMAYMEAAGQSAGIRTHLQTGRGVLLELFEKFHYNLGVLFDLTCDRPEMNDETETISLVEAWLDNPAPTEKTIAARCSEGRKVFREYSKALNRKGLLNLPTH